MLFGREGNRRSDVVLAMCGLSTCEPNGLRMGDKHSAYTHSAVNIASFIFFAGLHCRYTPLSMRSTNVY